VIVLVNGPFGVGKTSVSRLVAPRLGAGTFDPERIGWVLRRVVPTADYQDMALWRRLTVLGVRAARLRHGRLLVPMTLWRRQYFDQITRGFRKVDADFTPFRLMADPDVLRARILACEEGRDWRLEHMDRGLDAFADPHFGEAICANGSLEEVAEDLAARLA
jgi:predicted kinase